MGFSLTCAIYNKVERDDLNPGVVMWFMDDVIECGRVERDVQRTIDFNEPLPDDLRYHPASLAGTALISLLFKRFPKYEREHPGVIKAPPFFFKDGLDTYGAVRERWHGKGDFDSLTWERLQPGDQRLVPRWARYHIGGWPDLFDQFRHNDSLRTGTERKRADYLDNPLSWVPCSVLARWLDAFWNMESTSRLKLGENERARAKLMSWQGQLAAYGKIGAMVLLVPDDYY